MTGLSGARTVLGPGTLTVDGVQVAALTQAVVAATGAEEDRARAAVEGVLLSGCSVDACTSPWREHHHHRALDRRPSAWACRCRHGDALR